MRAVIVDPSAIARLSLQEVSSPVPDTNQALVRVKAFSLNRGEVNYAQSKPAGARIGWDIAGVIEQEASDGSGPKSGARVAGFVPAADGWAQEVVVPTDKLAEIPDAVSDQDAAALPVAGLTALYGLERGQRFLGSRVLVTGASGGVGLLACQLAKLMGAHVVAQIRTADHLDVLEELGVYEVVIDPEGDELAERAPYRFIFDGVGGSILSQTLPLLGADSTAVLYGTTAGATAEISIGAKIGSGNASVQGFNLYHETGRVPASEGLARLLELVRTKRLRTFVERADEWSNVGETARDLLDRKFRGKAVLAVA